VIDVRAIRQQHIGKGALVLIVAMRLEHDFFPPKAKAEPRAKDYGFVAHRNPVP